ncbi:hypothetical protein RRG08_060710 [Elysia crispata]|uniref:Uncharacterized protein n=1 Tax=Elysia crispata TaxID=231223 RepID=A0AAE0YJY2_9GAST|nr:hypothetical protein RRG08_060710 [Elysia crispata]
MATRRRPPRGRLRLSPTPPLLYGGIYEPHRDAATAARPNQDPRLAGRERESTIIRSINDMTTIVTITRHHDLAPDASPGRGALMPHDRAPGIRMLDPVRPGRPLQVEVPGGCPGIARPQQYVINMPAPTTRATSASPPSTDREPAITSIFIGGRPHAGGDRGRTATAEAAGDHRGGESEIPPSDSGDNHLRHMQATSLMEAETIQT